MQPFGCGTLLDVMTNANSTISALRIDCSCLSSKPHPLMTVKLCASVAKVCRAQAGFVPRVPGLQVTCGGNLGQRDNPIGQAAKAQDQSKRLESCHASINKQKGSICDFLSKGNWLEWIYVNKSQSVLQQGFTKNKDIDFLCAGDTLTHYNANDLFCSIAVFTLHRVPLFIPSSLGLQQKFWKENHIIAISGSLIAGN